MVAVIARMTQKMLLDNLEAQFGYRPRSQPVHGIGPTPSEAPDIATFTVSGEPDQRCHYRIVITKEYV